MRSPLVAMVVMLLVAGCGGVHERARTEAATAAARDATPRTTTTMEHDLSPPPAGPSDRHNDPIVAVRQFLHAVADRDAQAVCGLTLPQVQREDFDAAGVPRGGSCVERARTMFDTRGPDGLQPWWALLGAHLTLGRVDLHCASADYCDRARVVIEGLPQRGGGTTSSPLRLTYRHRLWWIGRLMRGPRLPGTTGGDGPSV